MGTCACLSLSSSATVSVAACDCLHWVPAGGRWWPRPPGAGSSQSGANVREQERAALTDGGLTWKTCPLFRVQRSADDSHIISGSCLADHVLCSDVSCISKPCCNPAYSQQYQAREGKEDEEEEILAVLLSSSPFLTCSLSPGSAGTQMTRACGRLITPGRVNPAEEEPTKKKGEDAPAPLVEIPEKIKRHRRRHLLNLPSNRTSQLLQQHPGVQESTKKKEGKVAAEQVVALARTQPTGEEEKQGSGGPSSSEPRFRFTTAHCPLGNLTYLRSHHSAA
ncbi:unnamed protein product [Pleuronectes platessa]|uniref:Uncharacterized protein n=1 Tax=Pleuronectes platessa TaxID=8262 RepID=A0A9N7Y797_PLEPL|nr:unnamed protein product [Pleuronectes platessa]